MYNRENKNWNNFALGILVMILPLLALPDRLTDLMLVALGFFIALFSLARIGRAPHHEAEDITTPPTV